MVSVEEICGILESIRIFMCETETLAIGSSIIKIVDPTLQFTPNDLDLFTPGEINYKILLSHLSRIGYTRIIGEIQESKYNFSPREPQNKMTGTSIFGITNFSKNSFVIQVVGYYGNMGDFLNWVDLDICRITWYPHYGIGLKNNNNNQLIESVFKRQAIVLVKNDKTEKRAAKYRQRGFYVTIQ
jgi:hypothetical protein